MKILSYRSAEFFTNDLRGSFGIHLQGFSSKGPVSGTTYFYVKKEGAP